jgi:hypothetical protein
MGQFETDITVDILRTVDDIADADTGIWVRSRDADIENRIRRRFFTQGNQRRQSRRCEARGRR